MRALWIGVACLAAMLGQPVRAAEILLKPSAIQKLVKQAMFKDRGRLVLMRGPCDAWLDNPRVSLPAGRVQIAARLNTGGACFGIDPTTGATVSGVPVTEGGLVRLRDLRVVVDDPATRNLMDQLGVTFLLPTVVDLDVQAAVRTMLAQGLGDVQAEVESFSFQDVSIANNRLAMRFEFRLVGR